MTAQYLAEFEDAARIEATRLRSLPRRAPTSARLDPSGWWSAAWNDEATGVGGCVSPRFKTEAEALTYARSQLTGFDPVI